jgi:multiple antibiotic resistance protein
MMLQYSGVSPLLQTLIGAFVTLFVVIDPVGLGPIFIGLTSGMSEPLKRKIGIEACLVAFGVLACSALFGTWLLTALGISLAAFRIAGGLLLFAIAFEMVFERRQKRKVDDAVAMERPTGIAAFPLGIPLMAGPGAITAVLLLAGRMNGDWVGLVLLIGVIALMILGSFLVFLASSRLERLLGVSGQAVFARLLGVLIAALAVQYVADGVLSLRG